ncbi:MAG: hypothetical protein Q8R74_06485 [Methylophilus sp.]|nr:hypothetical protein [Methylophilus sp.]
MAIKGEGPLTFAVAEASEGTAWGLVAVCALRESTACAVAGTMTPASNTAMILLLIIADILLEPVDFAFLDIIVFLHTFISSKLPRACASSKGLMAALCVFFVSVSTRLTVDQLQCQR